MEYVSELISYIRRLHICWYGGEPLLAQESIKRLSEAFLQLCKEYHMEYSADIITNGTLDKNERKEISDEIFAYYIPLCMALFQKA